MTKQEALELSVEMWTWLADNPTKGKYDLPKGLNSRVRKFRHKCPLCQLYNKEDFWFGKCAECPLAQATGKSCMELDSVYEKWVLDVENKGKWAMSILSFLKGELAYIVERKESIKKWSQEAWLKEWSV